MKRRRSSAGSFNAADSLFGAGQSGDWSVQDATAAVNVEVHGHFHRPASSGLKPPLQESFGGQFVQDFVATAFYDFDFIHFAAPGVDGEPKETCA